MLSEEHMQECKNSFFILPNCHTTLVYHVFVHISIHLSSTVLSFLPTLSHSLSAFLFHSVLPFLPPHPLSLYLFSLSLLFLSLLFFLSLTLFPLFFLSPSLSPSLPHFCLWHHGYNDRSSTCIDPKTTNMLVSNSLLALPRQHQCGNVVPLDAEPSLDLSSYIQQWENLKQNNVCMKQQKTTCICWADFHTVSKLHSSATAVELQSVIPTQFQSFTTPPSLCLSFCHSLFLSLWSKFCFVTGMTSPSPWP